MCLFRSSVGVLREVSLSGSDCGFVASQSFSPFRERQAVLVESEEGMSMEDTPEQTPPASKRRIQPSGLEVDQRLAALYQADAKRMLDYLGQMRKFGSGYQSAGIFRAGNR